MMQPLFVRQTPKRGRVFLMLGASLLVHGGLIGIASLWDEPQPQINTVVIDIGDARFDGPPQLPPVSDPLNTESTPTPSLDEPPVPTVPTVEKEIDFAETSPTPLPHKPSVSKPVTAAHVVRPSTAAGPASNQTNGLGPASSGTGSAAISSAWVMPHPPYPHFASALRPTGSTTVRIVTDSTGRVSDVIILKSAGNPLLDNQTQTYVRTNWHGPPNASRTTEFVYQIR